MAERMPSCGILHDTSLLLQFCNEAAACDWTVWLRDAAKREEGKESKEEEIHLQRRAKSIRHHHQHQGRAGSEAPIQRQRGGQGTGVGTWPKAKASMTDDNLSGISGMEVDDRISYLEQRLQLQEDEIQVLKAALADSDESYKEVYLPLLFLTFYYNHFLSFPSHSKPKEATFSAEDGYVKMFLRGRPIPMFVPDAVVATYSLDAKLDLPHKKLKLDWVYGYRGRDCRTNLFLLPTGEIVYFVAAVAVLYNVEEQRQRHYLGHTDDIKCLAVHPDMVTIATGQVAGTSKDGKPLPPHVRVWDSVSLNTLHVLGPGPFDRAVSCVGFSKSCSNESVLAATFHPTEPTLLITCGKSHIHFWTLEGGNLSKRQGIFEKHEKPKYVLCIAFTENGDTVTGDSGGNLYIWGKGGNRICHAVPGAHEGGIFGLCVLRNGTIVTGGGRDRRVGHTEELWGLATHPTLDQFLTCGQDKQVHLWSVATHQPLWSKGIEDAARSAGFHPSGSVLVVGTVTGRWLVLDTETRDLVTIHTDGAEPISVVSFSPDGKYLALGSHDNFVYIYLVSEGGRKYGRVGKCSGHSSFITHLDWAFDSSCLVTNSGDYEILYWIWPEGADGTDINAVCRSHDGKLLASADDFGKVHLFSYPCCQPRTGSRGVLSQHKDPLRLTFLLFLSPHPVAPLQAPSYTYNGHSSHVTNIAFLHDDSLLLSTGGTDTSVLQWRLV
ncbi:hypothetical protein JD844_006057 [Phrynosoma platyrhinos]|uniref:EMAP like 2 n=1 Tax=Phrynosoma platyrhinos TaxID=52577 RepID=A0ABQ7TQG2_PHRPL|nr:hypothetical protein JD844_006057 [Phrynosoma platyrhinos]